MHFSKMKNKCINGRGNEAWYEADERAPAGLNEVIFFVVIGFVHMLCTGEAN